MTLILKPRQTTLSPEVEQFFNRADTGVMTSTQYRAYVRLIDGLVAADIWDDLDVLQIYATNRWENARLNLKDGRFTATVVNDPGVAGVPDGFTANLGFAGNGVDSYLNTNFQPGMFGNTNAQQNTPQIYHGPIGGPHTCHFALWVADDTGFGNITGAGQSLMPLSLIWVNGLGGGGGPAGPGAYLCINTMMTMPTAPNFTDFTGVAGLWSTHRWGGAADASALYSLTDTVRAGSTLFTSTGLPGRPFLLGAVRWDGTTVIRHHTRRYAMFSVGGTLMNAVYGDTDKLYAYYRLLRSYMLAVGVPGPFWWG